MQTEYTTITVLRNGERKRVSIIYTLNAYNETRQYLVSNPKKSSVVFHHYNDHHFDESVDQDYINSC